VNAHTRERQRADVLAILDGREPKADPYVTLARIRAEVEPRAARRIPVNASVILAILDGEA